MRARAAYISSFGTTGILVASALMMLATVSAIVGFRGWPDSTAGGAVPAVPLTSPQTSALRVVRHTGLVARRHHAGRARAHAHARAAKLSTAGLVKVAGPAHRARIDLVKVERSGRLHGPTATYAPAPAGAPVSAPATHLPGSPGQPPSQGGTLPPLPPLPTGLGPSDVRHVVDGVTGQLPPLPIGSPVDLDSVLGSTSLTSDLR